MKINLLLVLHLAALPLSAVMAAPEPTPSSELSIAPTQPVATATPDPTEDLEKELRDREAKILTLTIDEQLKLRAAQTKAGEDPEVKEAVEKRNKAVQEFRTKFRETMIKIDPSVEALLDRIAVGRNPGF